MFGLPLFSNKDPSFTGIAPFPAIAVLNAVVLSFDKQWLSVDFDVRRKT